MSKLIFFVDDDKMILNLIEYTIKNRKDYDIKTFTEGEKCIENLNLNPNLIILDLRFKNKEADELEGLRILKEIKKLNTDQKVFILSSNDDENIIEKLMKSGASGFIPKNDYFIDSIMEVIDKEL